MKFRDKKRAISEQTRLASETIILNFLMFGAYLDCIARQVEAWAPLRRGILPLPTWVFRQVRRFRPGTPGEV
jgi:hypothetical protein